MKSEAEKTVEAMSSFLTFRYLVREDMQWKAGWRPDPYRLDAALQPVLTASDIDNYMVDFFARCKAKNMGLLLSGGMDSAVVASYLPKSTRCYTIKYEMTNAMDESAQALEYATHWGLSCSVVNVGWRDVLKYQEVLMRHQKFPLHPAQIAVYKACLQAKADGMDGIVTGNGADCTFGGFYKLLGRDWTLDEFMRRFTFVDPALALGKSVTFRDVYEQFWDGRRFETLKFLKRIHSTGLSLAFGKTMECAGVNPIEPFEYLVFDGELNLDRIRGGEEKYLIRELFAKKYGEHAIPRKSPFGRPVDAWLRDWEGPARVEFKRNCAAGLTGDQKWLLYTLEQFLNLIGDPE